MLAVFLVDGLTKYRKESIIEYRILKMHSKLINSRFLASSSTVLEAARNVLLILEKEYKKWNRAELNGPCLRLTHIF